MADSPEPDNFVQTCRFVDYSDIKEQVFDQDETKLDTDEFEELLGKQITWGGNNRTLVSLTIFCDTIRACATTEEEDTAIVDAVGKIVPYNAYIDMEN